MDAIEGQKDKRLPWRRVVGYIVAMSICLFLYTYFKTLAAEKIPATQIYPLFQGGSLLLSTVMSMLIFGEKPNGQCIMGCLLCLAGLLVVNMG